jgi:opacity protein-like surface antigen
MRLATTAVGVGLLLGCASSPRPPGSGVEADALDWTTVRTAAVEPAAEPAAPEYESAFEPAAPARWATLALAEDRHRERDQYLVGKMGMIMPEESDLDPGFIGNVAFGRYLNRLLAIEFEGGYAMPDPDASSADLFMVPMMVNARIGVPIAFLEVYGGAGLGTVYYKLEVGSFDEDGFLFAGDIFAGAEFVIRDRLSAGFELKYYITDQIDASDDHLSGLAAMVTVGWRL